MGRLELIGARNWTKRIVRWTSYVGVRDEYSVEFLRDYENVNLVRDSVFALPPFGKGGSKKVERVGINLVQYGKIYMNDPEIDLRISRNFSLLLEAIPERFSEIVFFSFNEKECREGFLNVHAFAIYV